MSHPYSAVSLLIMLVALVGHAPNSFAQGKGNVLSILQPTHYQAVVSNASVKYPIHVDLTTQAGIEHRDLSPGQSWPIDLNGLTAGATVSSSLSADVYSAMFDSMEKRRDEAMGKAAESRSLLNACLRAMGVLEPILKPCNDLSGIVVASLDGENLQAE